MLDVILLFYISLSSSFNINTLRTSVDLERFSVVGADHLSPNVWPIMLYGLYVSLLILGAGARTSPPAAKNPRLCLLYTPHKSIMLLQVHIMPLSCFKFPGSIVK